MGTDAACWDAGGLSRVAGKDATPGRRDGAMTASHSCMHACRLPSPIPRPKPAPPPILFTPTRVIAAKRGVQQSFRGRWGCGVGRTFTFSGKRRSGMSADSTPNTMVYPVLERFEFLVTPLVTVIGSRRGKVHLEVWGDRMGSKGGPGNRGSQQRRYSLSRNLIPADF